MAVLVKRFRVRRNGVTYGPGQPGGQIITGLSAEEEARLIQGSGGTIESYPEPELPREVKPQQGAVQVLDNVQGPPREEKPEKTVPEPASAVTDATETDQEPFPEDDREPLFSARPEDLIVPGNSISKRR